MQYEGARATSDLSLVLLSFRSTFRPSLNVGAQESTWARVEGRPRARLLIFRVLFALLASKSVHSVAVAGGVERGQAEAAAAAATDRLINKNHFVQLSAKSFVIELLPILVGLPCPSLTLWSAPLSMEGKPLKSVSTY